MEMTKPSKNQDDSVRWRPSSHEKDPCACRAVVLTQVQPRRTIFRAFMFRSTRESNPGHGLVSVRQVHRALPVTHTLSPWCVFVTWCLRRTLLRRRVDMSSPNLFFGGCFAVEGATATPNITRRVGYFYVVLMCNTFWGAAMLVVACAVLELSPLVASISPHKTFALAMATGYRR